MDAATLPYAALLALMLSVFLIVLSLLRLLVPGADPEAVRRRMARARGLAAEPLGGGERSGLKERVLEFARRLGESVAPTEREVISEQRVRFLQAGLRGHQAPFVFWGVRLALLTLLVGAAFFLRFSLPLPQVKRLFMLIMAFSACLGYYLPALWLRERTKTRKRNLTNEMPDVLDLLVVCVEAGMGLDQAIERVSREVTVNAPEMSQELKLLTLELRAGMNRHTALRNLSLRMGLDDVDALVTLLIQADAFGTSVATTLRVYSDTMRTKRFQRAEETAAKLPVKLLFPLILFILPALFVVIIGPAALQLGDIFARINP